MISRSKLFRIAAFVFVLINAGGALYALRMGEGMHAAVHGGMLMIAGTLYFALRGARNAGAASAPVGGSTDAVLDRLETSVDSIALEVERIGEAQRFNARVLEERAKQGR